MDLEPPGRRPRSERRAPLTGARSEETMRIHLKPLFLATTLAAVVTLPGCMIHSGHTLRTLTREVPAAGASSIRLTFPVGELTVIAADSPQIGLDVKIQCDHGGRRCAEAAQKVDIQVSGNDPMTVSLSGWPHSNSRGMKVRATVRVPRDTALTTELGVGRMTVSGVGSDLRAHLGVGDVEVTLPEAGVASVRMDSGVCDASLRRSHGAAKRSGGFLSHSVSWHEGTGKAAVRIDCGVGHARAVLR